VDERYEWAKKDIEKRVADSRYCQHFAVHEVEAWLLSQPGLLPPPVQKKLPGTATYPETVNFYEPPSYLLDRLYKEALRKNYKKVAYGQDLFNQLDPIAVRGRCPYFKRLSDDLIELAKLKGIT
jgi:hypothetical protein